MERTPHVIGLTGDHMRSPDSSEWHPLRVICVDDHADSLYVLKRLLALQRHEVRACQTVAEARAALAGDGAGQYDLLICDLLLPDGDGRDVMREAARLGVPGIAVSGLTGEQEHSRSREFGFVDHLDKPVLYDHLAAAIERVTGCRPDRGGANGNGAAAQPCR